MIITHIKTDRIKGTLRFHSELLPDGTTPTAHIAALFLILHLHFKSSSTLLIGKHTANATIDLQNYCNSLTPTPSLPLKTDNQAATMAAANQYHFISYVACNYCDKG